MIKDRDTNIVYLADKLETRHPDFFNRFTRLLNEMKIKWALIPHTKDIWARDFMPIQLTCGEFLQYNYRPDYLQDEQFIHLQTDLTPICEAMNLTCKKTDIIIDGGNITLCGDKVVMTDKVFTENNKEKHDQDFKKRLEELLGHEIIIIPWHCINPEDEYADRFGHSDGFIHCYRDNRVLMSNHRDMDAEEAKQIRNTMESAGFHVTEMLYDVENPNSDWNWAYINYLQVGQNIIMPSFGIPEDKQALSYVKDANPDCEVRQIRMRDIAAEGGALHCLTWNIRQ